MLAAMTRRRTQTFQVLPEAPAEDSVARVIAGWRSTRPELNVKAIGITARLARLYALIGVRQAEVIERFGIRGPDFALLATLVRLSGEDLSQRRLGADLGLSPATISLRIDRLAARGLVERQPDPDDGRGARISITVQGRELFEACVPEHLATAQALVAGLAEEELEELARLLGKLLYTLEDPPPDDVATTELGLVVEGAPVAIERRRAVGLPPVAGLLIRHVEPGGPAAESGLRPGDLLTTADRSPLRTRHDLEAAVTRSRGRRGPMALEVTRGAEPMRLALSVPGAR
jgi:DNA-binding MarR family transcriptional regulator